MTGMMQHMARQMAGFWRNCRGSSAIVFGLSLIPMALAAGGALDYTRYHEVRRELQTALDAATLAGASANNNTAVAQTTFAYWKTDADSTVSTPQFTASETATASNYTGTVNANLKMYFTTLVGIDTMALRITSHAVRDITQISYGDNCMWLLNTGLSLSLSNAAALNANACTLTTFGSTSLPGSFTLSAKELCVQNTGYADYLKQHGVTSTISTACTTNTAPKPPKARSAATCTSIDPTAQSVTLSPGTYCGGFDFNYTGNAATQYVSFTPGIYVITGGSFHFTGNANITGTGVTFYFADASSYLDFDSSNITSTLSAPTPGSCGRTGTCGVLMYEAAGLSNTAVGFDAKTTNNWTGNILLPSRFFSLSANATLNITGATEFKELTLNAKSSLNLSPASSDMSTSRSYTAPRLVR